MSEMAATLGIPPVFRFQGTEYKVSPRDFEVEAMAERKLEENALDAVKRFKDRLSPHDYQVQMDGWRRDVAARLYSYGSPSFMAWAFSVEGMKYMAYLQLAKLNADVTPHLIDRIWADKEAWEALAIATAGADADPTPKQTS